MLYRPADKPPNLTYEAARSHFKQCADISYPPSISIVTRVLDDGFEWIMSDKSRRRYYHREMGDPYVWEDSVWVRDLNSAVRYYTRATGVGSGSGIVYRFVRDQEEVARRCADALYVLRQGIPPESAEEAEAFKVVAEKYRAAAPPPEFPEEARRALVQAESAVREKRLEDAVDRYGEALKIAAWWPEGRFNRAMILGDLERYTEAMREMKRYLVLVPRAFNARDAQDKIYEWEDKVSRK